MSSLETPGLVQYLCTKNVSMTAVDLDGHTAEQRAVMMGNDESSSVYPVGQRLINYVHQQLNYNKLTVYVVMIFNLYKMQ
jgi:hypothetical protein